MKDLGEYLTEYVSSGRRHNGFPSEPDKDGILYWLETNGFEELENKNFTKGGIDLSEHYEKTRHKCFIVGEFDNVETSWIMIRDDNNTYMVRLKKGTENLRSANGSLIMFNDNGKVVTVTYRELKEEIERNA
jgi:hypothetical protein